MESAYLREVRRVREQMGKRAEEAERKLSDVAALQTSMAADLDAARAQLRLVSAGTTDVWHWQGDGHDDPASLACPVVMSAATLREFVAARERVAELEAERADVTARPFAALRAQGFEVAGGDTEIGRLRVELEEARADIALQGDALMRWREMTGCDTPHAAREAMAKARGAN